MKEVECTIADFVADKRTATPTDAAELAIPSIENLKQNVNYYVDAMTKHINYIFSELKMKISNMDRRLEGSNPLNILKHKKEILSSYTEKLSILIRQILNNKRYQFDILKHRLEGVNPLSIMDKGYSINSVNGEIITEVTKIKKDDVLTTEMKNGKVLSKVVEVIEDGKQ